jgi:hypothetical protein
VVVIDVVDGREVVVLGGALAAGRSAVSLVNGLDIAIAVTTSAAPTAVSSRQDPSDARQSLPTGIPRGFATSQTPASATAAGAAGQIAWDANYGYVCTATNTWRRFALVAW